MVRNEDTGKYLSPDGGWVKDPARAKVFDSIQTAGLEANSGDLCSVVLQYDDPPCELAINPAFCMPAPRHAKRLARTFAGPNGFVAQKL